MISGGFASREVLDGSVASVLRDISRFNQSLVGNLLPKKCGQSPEDRDCEIEGALAWMRNNSNRRAEWEMEQDTLLTVIQNDCNASFERH
jgi:hypothetical protein